MKRLKCVKCHASFAAGSSAGRTYDECFYHDHCFFEKIVEQCGNMRSKELYLICECGKNHAYSSDHPLWKYIAPATMTGDNVAALHSNISKYISNGEKTKNDVHGLDFRNAMKHVRKLLGLKLGMIPVPGLLDVADFFVAVPGGTKAGANYQKAEEVFRDGDTWCKNKKNPKKTEEMLSAPIRVTSFIQALKKFIVENRGAENFGELLRDFVYERAWVHKISAKVEVIVSILAKLRSFYPAYIDKFILEKSIFKPLLYHLYGRFPFMVGHSWQRGGAERVFEYMKGKFPGRRFGAWDFSGQDSTIKAHMTEALFVCLFGVFEVPTDEVEALLFETLYDIITGYYTTKYVSWIDGMRVMIGMMASGEFLTSAMNTIYSLVAVYSWIFYMARTEKWSHEFLMEVLNDIRVLVFGDDGMISSDKKFALHVLKSENLKDGNRHISLEQYLDVHWDLKVKISDSCESDTMLSVPDSLGNVPDDSIKILKRAFVEVEWEGKKVVIPYKTTADTLGKLLKNEQFKKQINPYSNSTELSHTYIEMCRSIGHAWDTMGANTVMFDICRTAYLTYKDIIEREVKRTKERLDQKLIAEGNKIIEERVVGRLGGDVADVNASFPDIHYLRSVFWNRLDLPKEPKSIERQRELMDGWDW
jgi:hypothetical protein